MRFIGSKVLLLEHIEAAIKKSAAGNGRVFCDIFAGSGAVARHFKPRYQIIANDLLHFSHVLLKATIENNSMPAFEALKGIGIHNPFAFLEETQLPATLPGGSPYFIAENYAPCEGCERMYLSPQNARRIDFIRTTIETWLQKGLLAQGEYYYLLACLIEGIPFVSNTTGTYGAYLKHWDKRAFKTYEMARLEVPENGFQNLVFNRDANVLAGELEGDILYMDPPYNSRQYAPNYHLLETVSRYDAPELRGITGMRPYNGEKSAFCVKGQVLDAFEDLVAKAKFPHLLLSYSSDGLMTSQQIEGILCKHGQASTFKRYEIPYRKYKSKKPSQRPDVYEHIYYVHKAIQRPVYFTFSGVGGQQENRLTPPKAPVQKPAAKKYLKSPLNYIGGKYKLLPQILPLFPTDIATFVDLFAGGANVGVNVQADKVICNDLNFKITELFKTLQEQPLEKTLRQIEGRIEEYGLSKTNEEGFLAFRSYYNKQGTPIDLYTLACYSYNYQFRFNNDMRYNNPFGRNRSQFSPQMRDNLIAFVRKLQNTNIEFTNQDFANFSLEQLGPQDFIYADPPYLITTGTYNDGKRGFKGWGQKEETQLLAFLDKANAKGIRFALSNVMEHKGYTNEQLLEWSKKYIVKELTYNYANASYNTKRGKSREVLIMNYGKEGDTVISIVPTYHTTRPRAFGWVQDPSNLRALCDVVAVFKTGSQMHTQLITTLIPTLVLPNDGQRELLEALQATPLHLQYGNLVGTAFTPRSASRCNGIVQAAVKGQKRDYIGDWPADNFVRWAHAFGFITYHYEDDTFSITAEGQALVAAKTSGDELNDTEKELLVNAALAYPPAVRILNLLESEDPSEEKHLTKFELGSQLGFVGEGGFTNMPQTVLIKTLAVTPLREDRNKMKADWEGSSDKYARMTAKWLEKLGLLEQAPKKVTVTSAGRTYTETLGQAYLLTAAGHRALNSVRGRSRHARVAKNVSYEMMATKGNDREYLRTRRTYILKLLYEAGMAGITYEEIQEKLAQPGGNKPEMAETVETIQDDVQGLMNIGIDIQIIPATPTAPVRCVCRDEIKSFSLPLPQEYTRSDLTKTKEAVRARLTHLPHKYLALIDLAYDSVQNRLFEMQVMELLTSECGLTGFHLGGARRPDGIANTLGLARNYGFLVDTKAYSKGYNLPISDADEMGRYVRENTTRDPIENPNRWWENFSGTEEEYYFLFVAGNFTGRFESQLAHISHVTNVRGAAIDVVNLLLLADALKAGRLSLEGLDKVLFQNKAIEINV